MDTIKFVYKILSGRATFVCLHYFSFLCCQAARVVIDGYSEFYMNIVKLIALLWSLFPKKLD